MLANWSDFCPFFANSEPTSDKKTFVDMNSLYVEGWIIQAEQFYVPVQAKYITFYALPLCKIGCVFEVLYGQSIGWQTLFRFVDYIGKEILPWTLLHFDGRVATSMMQTNKNNLLSPFYGDSEHQDQLPAVWMNK